jgi:hypothetical protein
VAEVHQSFDFVDTSFPVRTLENFTYRWAYDGDEDPSQFPATYRDVIFDGVSFTTASAGTTYRATAASDPDFLNFVARLTDGHPDVLYTVQRFEAADASQEWRQLADAYPEGTRIFGEGAPDDLAGYSISAMTLKLDSFTIEPSDLNGYLRYRGATTVTIEGTPLPEPSTVAAVAGAAILALRRPRGRFRKGA